MTLRASPGEAELAATALALLAQPQWWQAWPLPADAAERADQAPWTAYWAMRRDATLGAAAQRAVLQRCHAAFRLREDAVGALLAAAAAIESFYVEEGPLDPIDAWVEALQDDLPDPAAWPSPELEAHVMACGVGIVLRNQSHPLLAPWAQRGATLVRQLPPGAARVKLASFLVQYHIWRGEFDRTGVIVDAMPGLDTTGLLPAEALLWLDCVSGHAHFTGQHARGLKAIDAALSLARAHGLGQRLYALHAHGAATALAGPFDTEAQAHLDAMRPVLDRQPQADQTHYWYLHTGVTLRRGDAAGAVAYARMTLGNSLEIGGAYRTAAHRLSLGQCLLMQGDTAEALAEIDEARRLAESIQARLLAFSCALMRAACLMRLEQPAAADAALREALATGARNDYRSTSGWWLPELMAGVAERALDRGIETAYVRRWVRARNLPGRDDTLADWPWRLRLRCFGELRVELDDVALERVPGRNAQRPLDLLRALLAHGAAPLPVATALQWLWPEGEPAAQRKAFDAALLRLRRLLGDDSLLELEGGRLALAADRTWTDVAALQSLMQRIGAAHDAPLARLQDWARRLLDLMRGPFLGTDAADWIEAARTRYRQRFVVTVAQLAERMQPLDETGAVRLYERALDIDPMAESLARRLMRLHAQRGDRAQALRVLRMCTTMLEIGTGLAPSRETLALARELGLDPPGGGGATPQR